MNTEIKLSKNYERFADVLNLVEDTFKTGRFDCDMFSMSLNPLYKEDPELHAFYVEVCLSVLDCSTKMDMPQKLACSFITTGRANGLYYELQEELNK